MSLSVVVVTWNCAGYLGGLVDSMNSHLGSEVELIVVDNASEDNPRSAAEKWRGTHLFIELEENVGFGAASNAGVREARHDGVVLLNPDTELLDGGLADLATTSIELGALVGPRVVNPDGTPQPSASGPPVGVWPWLGALIPGAVQPPPLVARTEPWRLERRTRVAWLTGAVVAGPRSALISLGPFDEAIHLYSEDIDLGLRAAAAGIPSVFCPRACRVLHHGGGSSAGRFPEGGLTASARNRRVVVGRAFGARRESRGWWAQLLNLRLRVLAKRILGGDPSRERAALRASLSARDEPASD